MKRFLISTLAAAALLGVSVPAFAATAYPIGTVNIRSGPGTQNAIIGAISEGQTAPVIAHEGQWLKVTTPGGSVGYMADWVTREVFDDQATYLQVDTDVLNVRTQPDVNAPVLGKVQQGQQLRILEGLAGWYKVDAGLIGSGWVKGEFTYRITTPPATAQPTPPPDRQPQPPRAGLTKDVQAVRTASVRNGRSTGYDVAFSAQAWSHLTYLDSAEGWFKVANAAGDKGWINGTDVLLSDTGVDYARKALYGVKEGDWSIKFLKAREVVPGGGGLALRTGPSAATSLIRILPEGARVKLLQVPASEFVQVLLENGEAGWVSRNWLKPVPGAPEESVRLQQTAPGVLRLEVTGAAGQPQTGTGTLTVPMVQNANRLGELAVAEYGVASVSLGASGLTVRFDGSFRYQTLSSANGALVLEIRPVIDQVQKLGAPDRDIYRVQVAGDVAPSARRDGDAVVLALPGARLADGVALPPGLTAQADGTGVILRAATNRAFALKRGAGTWDLVLLAPGLIGKTVVVDPGHGGSETGASGPAGLNEKTANLGIALKLKALLETAGARVVMTRTADTRCARPEDLAKFSDGDEALHFDLDCRSTMANTSGADLFVSVHSNASPDLSVRGTETYWSEANLNANRSYALAGLVQQDLVASIGLRNLGVKSDLFYVTKYTDAPAILVEVAFISNSTEGGLLAQDAFRQKAAEGIFRGISRYWNQ